MEIANDYDKKIENLKKRIKFLFGSGKYELTIKECEILLEEETNDYIALCYIVLSYRVLDKNNKALEVALNLVENYPEISYAYKLCGNVYFDMDNFKLAINYCNKAIELDPNNADAYYIKAFSLKKLGGEKNLYEAVELTDKALSIDPEYDEYHIFAAGLYTHVGQYYKAKEEGEIALKLNTESSNAYLNYGYSLIYLGELEESIRNFYESLRLDPNNETARKNIDVVKGYIEKPESYYDFLEKRFFENDLKMDSNSEAFVILAKIFLSKDKYYEAMNVFYRFFKINKKDIKKHIRYAEILCNGGAMSEAVDYLKVLKRSNPKEKEIDEYMERIYRKAREANIKIYSKSLFKIKIWRALKKEFTNFNFLRDIIKVLIILKLIAIFLRLFR
ncbi:tetratricopeptide repeat protein [Clostridium felsineum]|uniref:tetratricopeptide repeat protein n=1 Tax=Clostridium felsineum TaxID=36839 RepID=UPI00098C0A8B|nr:tetratricopeptide repeat protein [Clostridium felsineum]URZ04353.1 Beta-barrel assembly-enhancing protease [Clostridium felsineum]